MLGVGGLIPLDKGYGVRGIDPPGLLGWVEGDWILSFLQIWLFQTEFWGIDPPVLGVWVQGDWMIFCQTPDLDQDLSLGVYFVLPL